MSLTRSREEILFEEAILQPSEAERVSYLDQVCHNEPALPERLELMLEGHCKAQSFLDPVPDRKTQPSPSVMVAQHTEKPGDRIGRYKLQQQIGEGGCGVV